MWWACICSCALWHCHPGCFFFGGIPVTNLATRRNQKTWIHSYARPVQVESFLPRIWLCDYIHAHVQSDYVNTCHPRWLYTCSSSEWLCQLCDTLQLVKMMEGKKCFTTRWLFSFLWIHVRAAWQGSWAREGAKWSEGQAARQGELCHGRELCKDWPGRF
jgi:hypothetical protein